MKTIATVILVVGMVFGGSTGYKLFRKFTWVGTSQGIGKKAFAFIFWGAIIGMIPAGLFLKLTGTDIDESEVSYYETDYEYDYNSELEMNGNAQSYNGKDVVEGNESSSASNQTNKPKDNNNTVQKDSGNKEKSGKWDYASWKDWSDIDYCEGWVNVNIYEFTLNKKLKNGSCGTMTLNGKWGFAEYSLYYEGDGVFHAKNNDEVGDEYYIAAVWDGRRALEFYDKDHNYEITYYQYEGEVYSEANDQSEYMIPGSDSRYLDYSDLAGFSADMCRIARNEIYARHGRIFSDPGLKSYFESKSWYRGTVSADKFDDSVFNKFERENLLLISEYEKSIG